MSEAESSHKQHEISLNVADPLCGRVLNGRFSIVEPIGSGGMGKVYKAIQSPLDRVVALKVLHPHFANSKDPGFVKRFVLEASMTSKLRHPNTVTVIDYGQTEDGIFYIAMEYLEGHTVAEMLAKQGAVAWQRAVGIGQQVCRSLREAHKFGILHRDLKPANVMLLDEADNDVVKVLDFGLVKSFVPDAETINPQITQNGMLLGSPQYMAPEQAKNQSDPRSDIYSFGILLYEMLTTRPPFQAKDYLEVIVKHIKDPPPTFRQMRPDLDLPVEVERVVMRCLEKEPHHRYQTMDELLDALRLVGGGQVGLSSSFQAQQQASQTGKWAIPAGTTPPPLPGQRGGMVTPNPNNPSMMPATPAPSGYGPTGAHMRNPTGQFYHLTQQHASGQTPAPAVPSTLFGSVVKPSHQVPVPEPLEPNLFSVASPEDAGGGTVKTAAIVGVSLLVLGLGGWLLTRETRPTGAEQAKTDKAATPAGATAVADKAASDTAARQVRFKVSTQPSGAQVFMGARDLGHTPTTFEMPPGPDGTATAELVFILDGHHPLAVTAGGSGDVLITQRLQKKSEPPAPSSSRSNRVARNSPPPRDEVPETVVEAAPPPPAPGPSTPPSGANGFQQDPYAAPSNFSASATASAAANRPATIEAAPSPEGITVPAAVTTAAPNRTRASDGAEIHPFGEGMERPTLIETGKPVQYSREALAARVQGLMIVKCVITTAGRLENCRVIKSLPYMEKPVLESLYSRLYRPVTFQGQPVSVDYVFDVKLILPRR